jgi:hypothetical protein
MRKNTRTALRGAVFAAGLQALDALAVITGPALPHPAGSRAWDWFTSHRPEPAGTLA